MQNAVGVEVESHLDLRHAARRRRNITQIKLAKTLVGGCHFTLTLQHVYGHRGLIVVRGGKHLLRLGRNRGVLGNQLGHDAAQCFDAERQGCDVEQQHVFDFALQHAALDRRTDGDCFIRIHIAARLFAEEFFYLFLHFRHARHAADQDHILDIGDLNARIFDRHLARADGALDQFLHQAFEFGASDFHVQVFRAGCIGRDVGQIHFGLLRRRQLDFGFLRRFFQALQREHIFAQVDALFFLELVRQVVDHALVEIFATEESIAVGGQHFELMLALDFGDFDNRNIEGATAQVIHRDFTVAFLLVHAECQRGRRRLVDDAFDFQTGDAPGVFGGLALRVVEISGHRDHGFGDFFAQIIFSSFFHFAQHLRGNFRRRHFLAAHFHPGIVVVCLHNSVGHEANVFLHHGLIEAAANQALHRE